MPITVGSVGDIIAICQLVKDCIDALSDSRGSTASYQAVIQQLYVLEKALPEIDLLSRIYSASNEPNAFCDSARKTVDDCRKCLVTFKTKISKYGPYLGRNEGGSGSSNVIAKAAMKLAFISRKDDIARFRAEVVAYSISMNQLLMTATM